LSPKHIRHKIEPTYWSQQPSPFCEILQIISHLCITFMNDARFLFIILNCISSLFCFFIFTIFCYLGNNIVFLNCLILSKPNFILGDEHSLKQQLMISLSHSPLNLHTNTRSIDKSRRKLHHSLPTLLFIRLRDSLHTHFLFGYRKTLLG